MIGARAKQGGEVVTWICAALLVVWFLGMCAAAALPGTALGAAGAGLLALALLLFVILHAGQTYGWRGAAAFLLLSYVVSFGFEAMSVATGFPFGFYVHHSPGPRLFDIPFIVPLGYVVYGWFAWVAACLIVRNDPADDSGLARFGTPLVATFVLAGWDYAFDATGAVVAHTHTYTHPSGLMGVPLVNFFGWLLTGWVAFQLFALLEARFRRTPALSRTAHWIMPCLVWLLAPVTYFIQFANAPAGTTTTGGRTFVIADVYEAAAAISLISMVLPAIVAILRFFAARQRVRSSL